jgi:hypothetical protein
MNIHPKTYSNLSNLGLIEVGLYFKHSTYFQIIKEPSQQPEAKAKHQNTSLNRTSAKRRSCV